MAIRRPLVIAGGAVQELPAGDSLNAFAPVAAVAGTAHSVASSDAGSYLRFTAAAAKVCTFRPEAVHALPANSEWHLRNAGAGELTLAPGAGVTLNPPFAGTLVVPTGGTVTVKRVAADVFDVMGVTA